MASHPDSPILPIEVLDMVCFGADPTDGFRVAVALRLLHVYKRLSASPTGGLRPQLLPSIPTASTDSTGGWTIVDKARIHPDVRSNGRNRPWIGHPTVDTYPSSN